MFEITSVVIYSYRAYEISAIVGPHGQHNVRPPCNHHAAIAIT